MANLKTDSPTSRRIVRAFLDFLNSVEPAPGADLEAVDVARECLEQVFKVGSFTGDDQTKPDSLVDIFGSLGTGGVLESIPHLRHESISVDVPTSSLSRSSSDGKEAKSQAEDSTSKAHAIGASKDELFGQFVAALEEIRFFRMMPDGSDDAIGLEKATRLFHDAISEMEKSGCQEYSTRNLAEILKSQGNTAMQSKHFPDAIEYYSCAIALCENSAVYYCNRAAAYTQLRKYTEAIRDCMKSIEIDPNYSKAYSRLGTAFFAQGNYSAALEIGFKKALQLDPSNEVVKENIRMAEQKLREDQQRGERGWSESSSSQTQSEHYTPSSRGHTAPPPFRPVPFDGSSLPANLGDMIMNIAANSQGHNNIFQNRQADRSESDGPAGNPGVQTGNINFTFGDQMPEEISGVLRSTFEMFSGPSPPQGGNSQSAPPS